MKTFTAKPETVQRDWYVVDATDRILGRLASELASRLRGKHKPEFTPNTDTGDYMVVINTDKLAIKGNNKAKDKMYYRHSSYPGGLKQTSFEDMMRKNSCKVLEIAVKGMLPRNPLGRDMFRKLKVYSGSEHPHIGQQPKEIKF